MAKALADAGYSVTVVSLGAPVEELRRMCPEIEYRAVTVKPLATSIQLGLRQRIERRRRIRKRREDADCRALAAGGVRGWSVRLRQALATPFAGFAAVLRNVFLVAPCTPALRRGEETFAQAWRALAAAGGLEVLLLFVMQFRQAAMTRGFARAAERAVRDRRFDVVQAHDNYALAAAARLAARDRARLICDAVELTSYRLSTNFSRFELMRERSERRREGAVLRRADAVITVGEGLADWYARHYSIARPLVVRNCRYYWPYETDRRLRADAGVGPEARLVVWFGGVYPEQGLEILIDAVPLMARHIHVAIIAFALPAQVAYVEVGLRQRARRRGVGDRVHVLPPRGPNDLVAYVSGADLGVIPRPSQYPNNFFSMPNKFLEMVMARLPIAVSRVGDMVDAIGKYGIGEAFDERDLENVAAVIERMLEPETLARLKANVMRAAEEMTWENESARYVALVRALMPAPEAHETAVWERASEPTAR